MSQWYNKITQDLSNIPDFIDYYTNEVEQARKEVRVHGIVERNIKELPAVTEIRFGQLQEIEAVLEYLNIQLRSIRRKWFKKYLKQYQRTLSSRDAEKYADGEQEVIDYECIINEVALLRNKFLGILKGLDSKNFMVGHIVRLRVAGMEDVTV